MRTNDRRTRARSRTSASPPIDVRPLLAPLSDSLVSLVRSLEPAAWLKPTCYPRWRVREIVSHLAQTAAGRLSAQRDGGAVGGIAGQPRFSELSRFIAGQNEAWARATASLSTRVLSDILALLDPQLSETLAAADPFAPATFPVAWAGEDDSPMWFDVAREFTERWHHQQQIREAVGRSSIATAAFLGPVIRTFVRCLPFWFRDVDADPGTVIRVEVTGEAGAAWNLVREEHSWRLDEEGDAGDAVTIEDCRRNCGR